MADVRSERPGIGRVWLVLLALGWIGHGCPGLVHVPRLPPGADDACVQGLVDALPQARLLVDTTEIDLGRALPRGTLVHGWSWNETWPDGGDGNWAVSTEAEIDFPLIVRCPRRLILWMAGPPGAGAPQEAEVLLNGRSVGRLQLSADLRSYSLPLAVELLRSGQNQLLLRFGRLWRIADGRRVAAMVEKVQIKPDSGFARWALRPVQATAQDLNVQVLAAEAGQPQAVQQPGDSWLDFGLLPRPRAEFRFLRQAPALGSRTVAEARVLACRDTNQGEACRLLARFPVVRPEPAGWVEERVPLPELAEAPVRLRLAVEGDLRSRGGWPGVWWGEPRIVSSRASASFRLGDAADLRGPRGSGGTTIESDSDPTRSSGLPPVPRAAWEPGWAHGAGPRSVPPVRHVIVYLIDTLRADVLVDPELDLPNLQRLLRHGIWAVDAWAPSAWTKPSTASVLTSREPSWHGAEGRDSRMRPDLMTLARWLEQHGVAAEGIVANGNVAPEFGFGQGFRRYLPVYAPAPAVHEAALQALSRSGNRRSFLYVHVVDPHDPYQPSEPWSHLLGLDRYTGPLDGRDATLQRLRRGEIQADPAGRRHVKGLSPRPGAPARRGVGLVAGPVEATGASGQHRHRGGFRSRRVVCRARNLAAWQQPRARADAGAAGCFSAGSGRRPAGAAAFLVV